HPFLRRERVGGGLPGRGEGAAGVRPIPPRRDEIRSGAGAPETLRLPRRRRAAGAVADPDLRGGRRPHDRGARGAVARRPFEPAVRRPPVAAGGFFHFLAAPAGRSPAPPGATECPRPPRPPPA